MAKDTTENLHWLLSRSRQMMRIREFDRLVPTVLNAFLELSRGQRAWLFTVDGEKAEPVCRGQAVCDGGELIKKLPPLIKRTVARVCKDRTPHISVETADEPNMPPQLVASIPLMLTDHDVVGAVHIEGQQVCDDQTHELRPALLELLAQQVAVAMENARFFESATNDPLTGLPNSSFFLVETNKALRVASIDQPAGILLLDLDGFKRVNDAAGAEMGDRALADIAATIAEVLRTDGLVARYSSDKFAILITSTGDMSMQVMLHDVAERARAVVNTKKYHGVQMSACIGGLCFPSATSDYEHGADVVAAAEDVLNQARALGPGSVRIR